MGKFGEYNVRVHGSQELDMVWSQASGAHMHHDFSRVAFEATMEGLNTAQLLFNVAWSYDALETTENAGACRTQNSSCRLGYEFRAPSSTLQSIRRTLLTRPPTRCLQSSRFSRWWTDYSICRSFVICQLVNSVATKASASSGPRINES